MATPLHITQDGQLDSSSGRCPGTEPDTAWEKAPSDLQPVAWPPLLHSKHNGRNRGLPITLKAARLGTCTHLPQGHTLRQLLNFIWSPCSQDGRAVFQKDKQNHRGAGGLRKEYLQLPWQASFTHVGKPSQRLFPQTFLSSHHVLVSKHQE